MVLFCQNSKNLKTVSGPYAKEATNQPDSYKVNRNGFSFLYTSGVDNNHSSMGGRQIVVKMIDCL